MHNRSGLRRQEVLEISTASRILAGAETVRPRPVKDRLDPTAHALRGLRLGEPDRLQHRDHQGGVYQADRQLTELRKDVSSKGGGPLLRVLGVLPSVAAVGNVLFGTGSE